jgi:hypothetical protein
MKDQLPVVFVDAAENPGMYVLDARNHFLLIVLQITI